MPYKLRKAPRKDLYWVVTIETGKKHSKDPIPKDKAKAQMRILESALKGGISLRMPKKPNQNGEYEMRDINGNLLTIVNTKQQALNALTLWFKFDEFQALAEILSKIDQLLLMPQMTPLIYKLLDELVTSYKNIAEKFLSTSKNERQKAQVRHVLNTDIAAFASEAGHPDFSVETIGQGKLRGGISTVDFWELAKNTTDSINGEPADRPEFLKNFKKQIISKLEGSQRDREQKIGTFLTIGINEILSGKFTIGKDNEVDTMSKEAWTNIWNSLFPAEKAPNMSERLGFAGRGKNNRKCRKCGLPIRV